MGKYIYHGNPERMLPRKERKTDWPYTGMSGEPVEWRARCLGILDPVHDGDTVEIDDKHLEHPDVEAMLNGKDRLGRTLTPAGQAKSEPKPLPASPEVEETPDGFEANIPLADDAAPGGSEPEPDSKTELVDALVSVKGIGKKTAGDIVAAYPTPEKVLAAIETPELADAIVGLTEKHYKAIKTALGD